MRERRRRRRRIKIVRRSVESKNMEGREGCSERKKFRNKKTEIDLETDRDRQRQTDTDR